MGALRNVGYNVQEPAYVPRLKVSPAACLHWLVRCRAVHNESGPLPGCPGVGRSRRLAAVGGPSLVPEPATPPVGAKTNPNRRSGHCAFHEKPENLQ